MYKSVPPLLKKLHKHITDLPVHMHFSFPVKHLQVLPHPYTYHLRLTVSGYPKNELQMFCGLPETTPVRLSGCVDRMKTFISQSFLFLKM